MKLSLFSVLTLAAANDYINPSKQLKTETYEDCRQVCQLVKDCHVWTWFEEAIPLLFHGICLIKKEEGWKSSRWTGAYTGFKDSDEILLDTRASEGSTMC